MAGQDEVQPVGQQEEVLRLRKVARRRHADADVFEEQARAVAKNPAAAKLDPPEKHLARAEALRRQAEELSDYADELGKRRDD